MTHDPSSPSKLLLTESNTRNLEAIDHVQVSGTRQIWYPSYWYEILVPVTWTEHLGRVSWALAVVTKSILYKAHKVVHQRNGSSKAQERVS